MKIIITACLFILASPTLHARIGDSPAQCGKIYGDPLEADPKGLRTIHKMGGVEITCRFVDGVCGAVFYQLSKSSTVLHPEKDRDVRFTRDQEAMLLNLNRAGSDWIQASQLSFSQKGDGVYTAADGKLQALVNFVGVSVETVEYHAQRKAAVQKAAIDKTIAAFGTEATAEPKPTQRDFSLGPEEQAQKDMEDSVKRTSESLERLKENNEQVRNSLEDARRLDEIIEKTERDLKKVK